MKKILLPLLVLALLCMSMAALSEGDEAITLEVNTAKLPVYAADDPYTAGFMGNPELTEENKLPVLLLPVKKSLQMQVTVKPGTVKNKKTVLAVDNEEIVRVKGNTVNGLKPGQTVLTIASEQDPDKLLQYCVVVYQPATRISLTAPGKSVAVGQTMPLTAAFLPESTTLKQVSWTSSDERIATVDENGNVTGVKRGNVRITAAAQDGSNIRANIGLQVSQGAEEIVLDKAEVTVDTGKTAKLKATVLPKDANDKNVVWSSSDERIAKVNAQGRITGVGLGDCEITCTSRTTGNVWAKAAVHVQQPVKKITFGAAPTVYVNETGKLTWTIEPENASNPNVTFRSGNEKILTVSEDGTVTGVNAGETFVNVVSTDGSNRQARIKVKVFQHVTGVHMKRKVAYVDPGQTSSAGAVLEPEKFTNHNMTWTTEDSSIATVKAEAKQPNRIQITGKGRGETVITGTTEDGGFQTSIRVKIGDWEKSLKWIEGDFDGRGNLSFRIKNVSDVNISNVTIEVEFYDFDGKPQKKLNTKDKSNVVKAVYSKKLEPGATTKEEHWKLINYNKDLANQEGFAAIVVRITEFQIDNDWVKVIRKNRQPKTVYDPHKVLH